MPDFILTAENISAPGSLTATKRDIGMDNPTVDIQNATLEAIKSQALLHTFYSRADLLDLFEQKDSAGLRLYPAFDSNDNFSTLVVATNSLRVDIVSGDTSKCFVAEASLTAARLTQAEGIQMVDRVSAHIQQIDNDMRNLIPLANAPRSVNENNYFKVFFSKPDIIKLLGTDASGVRFYTSKIRFNDRQRNYTTLTAVAVNDSGEENSTGLLSALPCPPNCGGGYTGDKVIPLA